MTATFESLQKTLQNERVLWIGFPEGRPLLDPAPGCALPELYVSSAHPNHWYMAFDPELGCVRDLASKLASLIGPYELIVLSKAFLHRNGSRLGALRVALLKLCHHASLVVVEGKWRSHNDHSDDQADAHADDQDEDQAKVQANDEAGFQAPVADETNEHGQADPSERIKKLSDQQIAAKVLDEISRVFALSTPGMPIGRISRGTQVAGERRSKDVHPRSKYEDRLRERWRGGEVSRGPRTIAVLGGGIAGITIALACLRRGHEVELFESEVQLLRHGSNQPLLATYPNFSKDANSLSLLTQYSLNLLADSPYSELLMPCGRFEPARSKQDAEEQRALVQRLALPQGLLQFMSSRQCQTFWQQFESAILSRTKESTHPPRRSHGGLWISLAAQLDVNQLRQHVCQFAVDHSSQFRLRLGKLADVKQLINQFDDVVVTAGEGTPQLIADTSIGAATLDHADWKVYSGSSVSVSSSGHEEESRQASGDKAAHQPSKRAQPKALAIIGGPVSLQKISPQTWLIGSSYTDATQTPPPEEVQWQHLLEGARLLTGSDLRSFARLQLHRGSRCVVRDRMPLIGPLASPRKPKPMPGQPDPQAQIYVASAFGSRGLLWAHLAARLITDHIDGISPCIGLKALKSVDPLRFAEKIRRAPHFDD